MLVGVGFILVFFPGVWLGSISASPVIEVVVMLLLAPLAFLGLATIRPSGQVDPLEFLAERGFDAGSAGTVVHKILEKHWHELERDDIFGNHFALYEVPESFKPNIIRMARNFKQTRHYAKLKAGAEGYFEHDFSMTCEGQNIRGSIDLFYFDEEMGGWVIVDFKTTALGEKDPETVIRENGYDRQLEMYARYLQSVIEDGLVVSKEICWLNID
jgi:ATP-dependent exoDNAse (exonuclease V) beta subunit